MDESEKELRAHWDSLVLPENPRADKYACDAATIEFYNENVTSWGEFEEVAKYRAPEVGASTVHKYAKGRLDLKMLDVGAGTGSVMRELKKLGAEYNNVDGLDAADKMLHVAQEKGYYKNTFVQYFTNESGFESESYDIVFNVGMFTPGHLPHDSLKEMYRITKPGGYIITVAKAIYQEIDPEVKKVRPLMEEMVKSGIVEKVEDVKFEDYAQGGGIDGYVFVLKRL